MINFAHVPARYVFTFVAMLGLMMSYSMRSCLSLAITRMVTPSNTTHSSRTELFNSSSNKCETFNWNEKTQGLILSAFYWGYFITHIPGSSLSQKFGGKYTFGLGILCTASFTVLTPLVVDNDPMILMIIRFVEGIGEGMVFPALYILLAQWAPPGEKGVMSTFIFLGSQIGTCLSNIVGGYILEYAPGCAWKLVFYVFGSCGIIWYVLWQFLCYNDPLSHPFISEEEKMYLQKELGCIQRKKTLKTTPWKHILTSVPIWALVIAEFGHDWGVYVVIADLPKFVNDVLKFNPAETGMMSGFPYLSVIVASFISSFLNDWITRNEILSKDVLRKMFTTISSVGPAIGMLCASYMATKTTVSLCFIFGMGTLAFSYSSLKINALDVSPNYAGSIMAVVNGVGCIAGVLAPYFVGLITTHRSVEEWRLVFWIMASVLVLTNFIFVIFGSTELEQWDDPDRNDEKCMLSEIESCGSSA
ncbi:sialin-like [Planococcus citri]|uniref:sialin-like n=1 Tax=Planococcus citri TaxID=170843 RepID=UPI0031F7E472